VAQMPGTPSRMQSNADPSRLQRDGWGMAWYENGKAKLLKSPRPIYKEKRKFTDAAKAAVSRIIIAHIRWMSNPLRLPRERLVSEENTQPFSHDGITFAHNGMLFIPREVRTELGKYHSMVRGNNDSEDMFCLFLKYLNKTGDFKAAFENSLGEIWRIWRAMPKSTRPAEPYRGMNIFASDGKTLCALSHYATEKPALCSPDWNYGVMAWRLEDKRLILASEPLDDKPWNALTDRQIMLAELDRSKNINLRISTIGGVS